MDNSVENLTLDTLATREDFPTTEAYSLFRRTITALDRFYKYRLRSETDDLRTRYPQDLEELKRYSEALRNKPRGRTGIPKRILVNIGWYENQSRDDLMEIRNIGEKGLAIIEALIERKYQDRYEV